MKQLGRAVPLLVCRPPFSLLVAALYSLLSLSFSLLRYSVAYTLYRRRPTSSLFCSSVSSFLRFETPRPPRFSAHVVCASVRTYVRCVYFAFGSSVRGRRVSQSAVRAGNDIIASATRNNRGIGTRRDETRRERLCPPSPGAGQRRG